jgi:chemotaxis response regulator CheB
MSKQSVNAVLEKATKATKDEHYEKIRHGAKLLAVIDPKLVRQQCPSCDRLFKTLAEAMGATI